MLLIFLASSLAVNVQNNFIASFISTPGSVLGVLLLFGHCGPVVQSSGTAPVSSLYTQPSRAASTRPCAMVAPGLVWQ